MCDASLLQGVQRLLLSVGVSVLLRKGSCLEPVQAVAVVTHRALTGEGTVVLYFTHVLALKHLLPDLNNSAYSYLERQKSVKSVSEGRLKRKINPGSF